MKSSLSAAALVLFASTTFAADWPQWMGPNRDGVWNEEGVATSFPKDGPKVLWRAKIGGGYAGPAVVGKKVYVTDFVPTTLTNADIRKESTPNRPKKPIDGKERVLCLDAETGKELWKYEYAVTSNVSYPTGPRCTPTVSDGRVYALGAEGHLACLDAETGKQVWKKHFPTDYAAKTPLWGFTGHPLVEGKKLICLVGGKDALLVAFDKDTGKELWKSLDAEEPGYCPPSIIENGGKRQVVIWDPTTISAVEPETGKKLWSVPLKPSYAMSIMAPQKSGDVLYAGGIGPVGAGFQLDATKPGVAKQLWKGTRDVGLAPVNSTPLIVGDTIYGVDQPGELRAVELKTGKRLWETYAPTTGKTKASSGTAFLVRNGKTFYLFGETGKLTIAELTPEAYKELGAAQILKPTSNAFGRDVVWSHPAFANKCVFARNDEEIVCVSLAK